MSAGWTRLAVRGPNEQEQLEASILACARSEMEKNAGEFTESLNSLLGQYDLTPKLDRFKSQTKLAMRMGRDLAKEAGIADTVMGAVKPLATKALGYAAAHPQRAMAAGGAGIGAIGGALTAKPGNRMAGALGGAALGGGAGYGLSHLPSGAAMRQGVTGLANRGLQKFALALGGLGRTGIGAAIGGIGGALHKSTGEAQGLEAGHHIRNALIGATGGALAGRASTKVPGLLSRAEGAAATGVGAAAHTRPPVQVRSSPHAAAAAATHTPADLRQMERVRTMANSPEARYGRGAAAANKAPVSGTVPARRPAVPVNPMGATQINPAGQTMAKMAQRGGREFLKLAFSMNAQAEPGTPGGAQEPEAESQFLAAPERPASKPAVELYSALKHLSPKSMRGLQVAQPGI